MDASEFKDRQIWVRAFYGFDPEGAGLIGFTLESQRTTMMGRMRDGDLVLIYGAVDSLTQTDLQRQALGFLEIKLEPCTDLERLSEELREWKVERNFQDRWTFGVKVRRAWRVTNRVHIKTIAPNSYHNRHRFERTTRAKLLEPEEARRALSHHVIQINVFGEAQIDVDDLESGHLEQGLSPSKGIPPVFGERSSNVEDVDNHVYLMNFSGGAEFLLGRDRNDDGDALVKVGRSNDPTRRLTEINAGFPERSISKWALANTQKFSDGKSAHTVESRLKTEFDRAFCSQAGEFFTGNFSAMQTKFQNVCVAFMPRILGAPGKAKGVK